LLLGTGGGVAFLAKGLLGPGLLGLLALSLPLLAPAWRTRAHFRTLLAAAAAALPWFVIWPAALYIHSPHLFTEWLWDNNFGRFFGTSGLGPKQETLFYMRILPWFAWPAWLLALWALWTARRSLRQPPILLPLAAFALTFLVLVFAADARQVYALPLLLPLALLAVPALEQLPRWTADGVYALGVIAAAAVAGLAWLAWSALEFGVPAALLPRLEAVAYDGGAGVPPAVVMLAAGYTLAGAAALYALRRVRERPVASWAVVTTLALGLSMTLLLGWLDERKGYHRVFAALRQAMPESYRCIASHGLGEPQRAMLHYYAGIKTHRLAISPATNCDLLLRQEWVTDQAYDPREWRVLWEGQRPGDTNEKFRLYRRY
jgi:4-amino-4-deoxy-L-arabinose transferase-like glycosyltransferase